MGKINHDRPWFGRLSIVLFLVGIMVLSLTSLTFADKKTIKIGATPDLSGPTSEVGKPFSDGLKDYFDYVNKNGGINGRKIELLQTDGAYNIPKETAGFKEFAMEGVVAFIGWSGGGHMQIAQMASKKEIVMLGASISEVFADIQKAPFSFIHCAPYDQVWRGMIDHSIKQNPDKKLKAALVYPDNGYGHQNAATIREYLKERGIDLVDEEIVGFRDIDATTQMLKMKRFNPDIVLCPQVEPSIAVIMRDARKVGIDTKKTQFYVNMQGIGHIGLKLGGKDVQDLIGGSPFSDWYEKDVPGIKLIRKVNADKEYVLSWYVHGWAAAVIISEGLNRIGDNEITGNSLKESLEGINNFDTGGITSPISYSKKNHVGAKGIKLYKPSSDMKYYQAITDFIFPQ